MQERLRKAVQLQFDSAEICERLLGYKETFENSLPAWFSAMVGSGITGIVKSVGVSERGLRLEIFGWPIELRAKAVASSEEFGELALLLDFVYAGDDQDVSIYKAWINKNGWLSDFHGTFARHKFEAPSSIEILMQMAALGLYESPVMQVGIGKPQPKGCMEIF
ncbi:hypothetical protein [Chromobacterium violaceum]|uniref:hypothetical protein n=1 Tax=Chromobacterium violaceum TaxID=536 RepID=UPI0005BC2102|nr:hypothetical protein [Chromobacterium violaceum]